MSNERAQLTKKFAAYNENNLVMMLLMDTPVPIPNTKVKLFNADSTSLVTDWEDRKSLGFKMFRGSSMVEHSAVNR